MRTLLTTLFLATALQAAPPQQAPRIPQAPCGCAYTGKCQCFEGECTCAACRKAAPAKATPKAQSGTDTTKVTPVLIQRAGTQVLQGKEPGFSEATSDGITYTLVPSATQGGCTSGNCPNTVTSGRRRR